MLKPLLKKQFLETLSFFLVGKNGKRRSAVAIVGFALLMLYAFGAVAALFGMIADTLCAPLVDSGLTWVYFALTGSIAAAFACVGSVFAAKSKLYEAKDNDLLLSMPIKPWAVLFSRMTGLYALAFAFCALAFVPAAVVYFLVAGVTVLSLLFITLTAFILPLGSLAVSALLGWLLALVTAKIRAKNLTTLLVTFAFLGVYFFLTSKMNEYLAYVVAHGEAVGAKMKTALFPFWQMGLGATGEPLGFLAFAGIFFALFAITYFLLDRTFLRLVTTKRGGSKAKYREKTYKSASAFSALLRRESLRFFKNPMIFLNCSLGSVFYLMLAVLAFFNVEMLQELAAAPIGDMLALVLALVVCAVASMNIVTASSVSLEGETLWNLRSLPVSSWQIFLAKLALHTITTAIPALVFTLVLCIFLKISLWLSLLVLLAAVLFTALCATSGLWLNLKFPNLHWTSETVAVKQSMSAMLAMFLNMGVVALFIGGYFLFGRYLSAAAYLGICAAALAAANAAIAAWLKTRGAKIFENFA